METVKYKVVLTGFGPFQNVDVNESWLSVSKLWEFDWPSEIRLVTRELPVVYDTVRNEINNLWEKEKPDLMIHVGVFRGGDKIFIEKCSFNENYESVDVNNQVPEGNVCIANGCRVLETKLDVDKLTESSNFSFQKKCCEAQCSVSEDPGQFLCGFSYYLSLHHDSSKSLFVHVPSKELFSIEEMALALRSIIFGSLEQLYKFKSI